MRASQANRCLLAFIGNLIKLLRGFRGEIPNPQHDSWASDKVLCKAKHVFATFERAYGNAYVPNGTRKKVTGSIRQRSQRKQVFIRNTEIYTVQLIQQELVLFMTVDGMPGFSSDDRDVAKPSACLSERKVQAGSSQTHPGVSFFMTKVVVLSSKPQRNCGGRKSSQPANHFPAWLPVFGVLPSTNQQARDKCPNYHYQHRCLIKLIPHNSSNSWGIVA